MRMKNHALHLFSILLVLPIGLTLANGCASQPGPNVFIVKHYQEDMPLADTALVMTTLADQAGAVRIKTIAEGVGMDGYDVVRHQYVLLKPGRYAFNIDGSLTHMPEVKVIGDETWYIFGKSEYIGLAFTQSVEVKADHVYYLEGFVSKKSKNWQATIKEIASGDIAQSGSDRLINGYAYVRDNYSHPSISRMNAK